MDRRNQWCAGDKATKSRFLGLKAENLGLRIVMSDGGSGSHLSSRSGELSHLDVSAGGGGLGNESHLLRDHWQRSWYVVGEQVSLGWDKLCE